jgi:dTDP-4-dehydrorhamnose 3,5-epimerase
MRPIVTGNGVTTELFRKDWGVAAGELVHMIHVCLLPGAVSAWHMHRAQSDHIVSIAGQLRVVLYDDREGSPTRGKLDVFNLAAMRPMLLVIPPGIWHGIQARQAEPGVFVNFFDHAYDHGEPDEWRLPADSEEIPFRF